MPIKMAEDQFYFLKQQCRLEEKIKGSQFIATARPCATESEALAFIDDMRKEFHDATHNSFAWRVGVGRTQRYRYSDDGEPSGTAGQPILRAIDGRNASNVCIVVTRYFGGTKLGTGGLMRAYGKLAQDLLRSCELERKYFTETLVFSASFDFVNVVHNIINSTEAELKDTQYGEDVTFTVEVRSSYSNTFRTKLQDATNGQVEFK